MRAGLLMVNKRSSLSLLSAAAISCMLSIGCREFGLIAVVDDRPLDAAVAPHDAGPLVIGAALPARDAGSAIGFEGLDASQPGSGTGVRPTADAAVCNSARTIEVCNPVKDTGCSAELGMQCDVDLQAVVLQGQCVFKAPQRDGGTCLNVPPTETCPPGQTCVDLRDCRRVCLCNSDCEPGNCCTAPLGEQRFRTCSPCG